MPKVVTTVNLDFDSKEKFVRYFGKSELSPFLRQAMDIKIKRHEELIKQKNEKAREKDLSPLASFAKSDNTIEDVRYKMNETLDQYLVFFKNNNDVENLERVRPKLYTCLQLVDSRIATNRSKKFRYSRT
jgi:K+/H+ antiporter YhaU regulatory subunit KhtT